MMTPLPIMLILSALAPISRFIVYHPRNSLIISTMKIGKNTFFIYLIIRDLPPLAEKFEAKKFGLRQFLAVPLQ